MKVDPMRDNSLDLLTAAWRWAIDKYPHCWSAIEFIDFPIAIDNLD